MVALDQNGEEIREVAKWFAAMKEAGEAPAGATATAREGDALNLPFPDDSFDVVIISEVMEHIPDDKGVLAEMVRVLKPGGRIAITVPRYGPEKVAKAIVSAVKQDDPIRPVTPEAHLLYAVSRALPQVLRSTARGRVV